MTKVATLEHAADRIRVNAICPGPVRTSMSERVYITGAELAVDGGYLAR